MQNWKPIKKVAVGFMVAALAYGARLAGADIGDRELNDAALAIVGILAAYLVPE